MTDRPTVLLLIPHLGGGGAERVIELLAQELNPGKYDLHLGLVTESSASSARIPPHVSLHCLGRRRVRTSVFSLIQLVRRVRPNVILSSMAHLNFLVLLLRPLFPRKTRVLVRQNGTVSSMLSDTSASRFTRNLYRNLYPRADRVICQSQAMADDLAVQIGISCSRLAVLHNPIEAPSKVTPSDRSDGFRSGEVPRIFAAGRLSREKGFDLLLEAVALLLPQFPTLQLSIAGRGPETSALRVRSEFLGLDHAVQFLGYQESLAACFAGADIFVLPSRYEGMPNTLLEAAAAGLPIVATPACGGILELLDGSPGTWLAHDVSPQSLANAISSALNAVARGARFSHAWLHPFLLEEAIPAYEALIDSACTSDFDRSNRASSLADQARPSRRSRK